MICRKCSAEFETRPQLMNHARTVHPKQQAIPVPPKDAVTAEEVAASTPVQSYIDEVTLADTPTAHNQLLMEAFIEIKDADAKAGVGQVMANPIINQQTPQEVLRLCLEKVKDGDARNIIRKKLQLT